jgi:hypothetical protein
MSPLHKQGPHEVLKCRMLNPPPVEPGQESPIHDNPIRWSDDGTSFYGKSSFTDCTINMRVCYMGYSRGPLEYPHNLSFSLL